MTTKYKIRISQPNDSHNIVYKLTLYKLILNAFKAIIEPLNRP